MKSYSVPITFAQTDFEYKGEKDGISVWFEFFAPLLGRQSANKNARRLGVKRKHDASNNAGKTPSGPANFAAELKDCEVVTLRQRVWDHRFGADRLALFLRYFNASPDRLRRLYSAAEPAVGAGNVTPSAASFQERSARKWAWRSNPPNVAKGNACTRSPASIRIFPPSAMPG
jgi:hypothetical protein